MTAGKDTYYKENRLKTLRAFCRTVETGNITAAAEKLFLSQPTVSLQIKALERELGISLFERHGPRLSLTPEGEAYYRLAQPLVEDFEKLDETFHAQFDRLEVGELSIAAGESTILHILPEFIKRFSETYPRVTIRLHNVTGRAGLSLLQSNEVDFAVGSMQEMNEGFFYRPIMTFDPMLIAPPAHPLAHREGVTLEDISQHNLILPPRHLVSWQIVAQVFRKHKLDFKVTLETGGWEVVKKYVRLGLGVSIVTGLCLSPEDQLVQVSLRRFFPQRSYGIVVRRGKYLSHHAKAFINLIDPSFMANAKRREML